MLSIALVATLALSPTLRTQQESWGTREGLPQSSVTGIGQGPDGLLTLGTFGGPVRFDGRTFDGGGVPDGSGWSSIRVTAVEVGVDGTQWLGLQDGGVVRVGPDGHEQQLPSTPGVTGTAIWDLEIDGRGLWVASTGGAAYWDGAWTIIPGSRGASSLLSDGPVMWIGGEFGLLRCDGGCDEVPVEPVVAVHELAGTGDDLLVAGEEGLVRRHEGQIEQLETGPVDHVVRAPDGRTWISRGARLHALGSDRELDLKSSIRRLFVDREANLWVGTDADGLSRIIAADYGLAAVETGVLPLLQRHDGTTWAGAGCGRGGLVQLDGHHSVPALDGCVRALAHADHDDIWVGMDTGLWRWSDESGITLAADVGHDVHAILPTRSGVWIGTDRGGAFVLRHGHVEAVDVGDDRVLAIAEGVRGELWFGTHWGLSRYSDADGLRRWTREDGAPVGAIRALHVDGDGTVLMGSYGGGLGVLRNGVLSRLTMEHGLRDNVVSAILGDSRGALWLNGNRGLMRLMRADLESWLDDPNRKVRVRRWLTPEGNGGGQPAGIVANDGSLLFASVAGVVVLDPRTVFSNPVVPQVVLIGADVDGVPLLPGTIPEIPPGPGRVQVEFTAGTLRHPELALLEYRVTSGAQQSDDGWKQLGDDRRVAWAGLPPGRYTIELRAANEDGLWSPSVGLSFELAAAWYQRASVWGGLGTVLLLLGVAVHGWRTREVERRNATLTGEIAQREVAEAALRLSEAHYRGVFEGGSDALFVVGPEGVVEQANLAAEQLLGLAVVGRTFEGLFDAASEDHGASRVRRDDAEVWAAVVQLPFEGNRVLARAADVSARVAADQERGKLSMRLARAERMEAVGRLAGGIAHDFNNLLTAVGGTADLLGARLGRSDSDESQRLIEGLRGCVDRGATLTRQLLAFARRQRLDPRRIDPCSLVNGLQSMLRPSLRDDVTLRLHLPDGRLGVHADAAQLELALVNLVLNAQDAMPRGGQITIFVRKLDDAMARQVWPDLPASTVEDWVVLEVADTGEGIAAEDLPRVLEPFFTTRPDGTGLGLPSVHGFAEQSGGALQLRSERFRGTRASIVLPSVRPPTTELVVVHRPTVTRGLGRVLVCDDDEMVRRTVVAMLQHGGYQTLDYGDPQELLDAFTEQLDCDLLVTDVLMPRLSGPELATCVLQRRPRLPVIFISGYTRDQIHGELPGPLLTKPFRSETLLSAVGDAIARVQSSAG